MNYKEESLKIHEKYKGKLETKAVTPLTRENLPILYTPGVAEPVRKIAEDKNNSFKYTARGRTVAVISDGSAVLGLGNVGPEAAHPVMAGKSLLFKELANIDGVPLCINSKNKEEFVSVVKSLVPNFGAINLEDIKAPDCFYIEKELQNLEIPVVHDDQHATAVVTVAAVINALKVVNKNVCGVKIVINGAGAAGTAVAKLLDSYCGMNNILVCDSKGIIYEGRSDLADNVYKNELALLTNKQKIKGSLKDALKDAEIFIGVSKKDILNKELISLMKNDPIIFAMANPDPEILPDEAKDAGARVVATGRSDFKNQVNNVLVFPGLFKGILDSKAKRLTEGMKVAAANALAELVEKPDEENILPRALDKRVVPAVSKAVKEAWEKEN